MAPDHCSKLGNGLDARCTVIFELRDTLAAVQQLPEAAPTVQLTDAKGTAIADAQHAPIILGLSGNRSLENNMKAVQQATASSFCFDLQLVGIGEHVDGLFNLPKVRSSGRGAIFESHCTMTPPSDLDESSLIAGPASPFQASND